MWRNSRLTGLTTICRLNHAQYREVARIDYPDDANIGAKSVRNSNMQHVCTPTAPACRSGIDGPSLKRESYQEWLNNYSKAEMLAETLVRILEGQKQPKSEHV